jgi:hypothetical protein
MGFGSKRKEMMQSLYRLAVIFFCWVSLFLMVGITFESCRHEVPPPPPETDSMRHDYLSAEQILFDGNARDCFVSKYSIYVRAVVGVDCPAEADFDEQVRYTLELAGAIPEDVKGVDITYVMDDFWCGSSLAIGCNPIGISEYDMIVNVASGWYVTRHELFHHILKKETGSYDSAHTNCVDWKRVTGEDVSERCINEARIR